MSYNKGHLERLEDEPQSLIFFHCPHTRRSAIWRTDQRRIAAKMRVPYPIPYDVDREADALLLMTQYLEVDEMVNVIVSVSDGIVRGRFWMWDSSDFQKELEKWVRTFEKWWAAYKISLEKGLAHYLKVSSRQADYLDLCFNRTSFTWHWDNCPDPFESSSKCGKKKYIAPQYRTHREDVVALSRVEDKQETLERYLAKPLLENSSQFKYDFFQIFSVSDFESTVSWSWVPMNGERALAKKKTGCDTKMIFGEMCLLYSGKSYDCACVLQEIALCSSDLPFEVLSILLKNVYLIQFSHQVFPRKSMIYTNPAPVTTRELECVAYCSLPVTPLLLSSSDHVYLQVPRGVHLFWIFSSTYKLPLDEEFGLSYECRTMYTTVYYSIVRFSRPRLARALIGVDIQLDIKVILYLDSIEQRLHGDVLQIGIEDKDSRFMLQDMRSSSDVLGVAVIDEPIWSHKKEFPIPEMYADKKFHTLFPLFHCEYDSFVILPGSELASRYLGLSLEFIVGGDCFTKKVPMELLFDLKAVDYPEGVDLDSTYIVKFDEWRRGELTAEKLLDWKIEFHNRFKLTTIVGFSRWECDYVSCVTYGDDYVWIKQDSPLNLADDVWYVT